MHFAEDTVEPIGDGGQGHDACMAHLNVLLRERALSLAIRVLVVQSAPVSGSYGHFVRRHPCLMNNLRLRLWCRPSPTTK